MGNYLNPYTQGQYVEDDITPIEGTLEWALQTSNQVRPVVTNNTKQNTADDLRKSLSFDLEGAQQDNDVLEKQFQEATANIFTNNPKVGLFNNLFQTIGNGFSTFGKTLGKGIGKGFDTLANNQGLQNAVFGIANSFIKPVNNSSGVDSAFQIGDQAANMLPGKAGLIGKGVMLGAKAINSIGGKRTIDFSVNHEAIAPTIGSYGGSSNIFEDAATKAGQKYGLFSSSKRRKANALIREARKQQNIITDITQENEDLQSMADDMDYLDYQNEMNGGFDQRFFRAAKQGMKFKTLNRIKNLNFKKLKEGGFIEYKEWTPIIITDSVNYYQQGGTLNEKKSTRTIEELIAYAKEQNPRFIQRMSEPLRYVKVNSKDKEGKDMWVHSTHLMTNRGNKVFPLVQEDPKGQLFIIDDEDKALNWATLNNNVLTFDTEEEALNFQNNYKQGWPDFFNASPLDINPEAEYEEYEPHKYKLLDLYSSVKGQSKKDNKLEEDTKEYPQEYIDFKNSLPNNQKNTPESEYRTYLYWQLWGKPKDFQYTLEHPNEDGEYMYNLNTRDNSYHGSSIAWGKDGIGYFIKPKHHSTLKYELDYFNKGIITEEGGKQRKMTPEERKKWEEFRKKYTLEEDGNFYKYVPIKQSESFKTGGAIKDSLDVPEIEETSQKNVIPEGALHKNKHHMENTDGLTKKGIPVVDNDGDQQAEIECNELILNLDNTKFIEERYNKFYSDELTQKEKDQLAIEVGELLVKEILYNTDDRTDLINKVE